MGLYKLTRIRNRQKPEVNFVTGQVTRPELEYDFKNGFVIRAADATQARKIAARNHSDEGEETWLDPKKSRCRAVKEAGRAGVILTDFHAG